MTREWKSFEINKTVFTVPSGYEILRPIGAGAYGSVVVAKSPDGEKVAIKKLTRPFQSEVHAKRTYRELVMLKTLNNPDAGVIQLLDTFTPEASAKEMRSLYLVLNFVPCDLAKVIKAKSISNEEHICLITYSILRALKYIHSAGIIHRDLKPSNIGIDEDSNIWILDFGLARQSHAEYMTGYVATRWWRAPEIMFNWERYNQTADVWSVGCIMGEMILGQPLFPGDDHTDQLKKILKLVGTPTEDELERIAEPNAKNYIRALPYFEKKPFREVFKGVSDKAVEALEKLLVFDPVKRPTADEAIRLPFFSEFHLPSDEPTTEQFVDSLKDGSLSIDEWKERIFEEVSTFKRTKRS